MEKRMEYNSINKSRIRWLKRFLSLRDINPSTSANPTKLLARRNTSLVPLQRGIPENIVT